MCILCSQLYDLYNFFAFIPGQILPTDFGLMCSIQLISLLCDIDGDVFVLFLAYAIGNSATGNYGTIHRHWFVL